MNALIVSLCISMKSETAWTSTSENADGPQYVSEHGSLLAPPSESNKMNKCIRIQFNERNNRPDDSTQEDDPKNTFQIYNKYVNKIMPNRKLVYLCLLCKRITRI
jgi:hypothetical protein